MSTREVVSAALVASCWLGSLGSPAWAAKGDMQVRLVVVSSHPTSDFSQGGQTTELDDAIGFSVGFEYGVTDRIGIEPAFSVTSHDLTTRQAPLPDVNGDVDWRALTANVNFHVKRTDKIDLSAGPTVGYAFWSDLALDAFPTKFETDGEFVYGGNVGIDVPFGARAWGFTAAVQYLLVDVAPQGGVDIGVDPLRLGVGLTYRF